MAIGGSDSAIQTQLKNLYTSNLDPNIVKNTPSSLPKAKPITQMVYEGATEDNPYGTGRKISQQIDIGPDFSGLTPDRNAVGGEETITYRKPVSPYIDAVYNDSGKLTGYEGNNNAYISDNSYVHGSFDTSGKANPVYRTKSAGGFFQGQLPAMVALAAGAYGLPGVSDAVGGSFGGIDLGATDASLGAAGQANAVAGAIPTVPNIGQLPTFGPGTQLADLGAKLPNLTPGTSGVDPYAVASDYSIPTPNSPYTANQPGGIGLTGDNTANLAGMAGAQGLTTAGTGLTNGTIGAAGGVTPYGGLGANIGTAGLAAGVGSLLGSGAASSPAAAIGAGSLLSDLGLGNIGKGLGLGLGASALGNVLGAYTNTQGIKDAMAAINSGVTNAQGTLKDVYGQQQGYQRPYMSTGTGALGTLGSLGTGTYQMYDEKGNPTGTGTGSGYLQHQFDASDLAKGLAPNYDFMLQQGQMANQRAANMAGGGFGGNALQGLNRYTQDYAGNAYQNAFTNYQNQRQNIFGNLSNLANLGQTATGNLVNAGTTYGTNVSNLEAAKAKAMADAQVAMAQQNAGAMQSVGNTALLAGLLNQTPNVAQAGNALSSLGNLTA
jgi:hypothetical protein